MTVVERQSRRFGTPERLNVITNSILLARRIRELQRRRQGLVSQQEHLRAQLPDWAVEPLRLVGMTGEEIKSLVNDWSTAETEAGLDDVEKQLDQIDRQTEELENMLVSTPSTSLEEIEAVMSLAVVRFREIIVTDGGRDGGAGAVIAAVIGVILVLVLGWFLLNMLGIMERGTDTPDNGEHVEVEFPDATDAPEDGGDDPGGGDTGDGEDGDV
jgi:hypothetical protein